MHEVFASTRRRTAAAVSALIAALTVVAIGAIAPPADAIPVPVTMKFDHGRTSISYLFADKDVIPANPTFPSDDLPLPQRTDLELTGTREGSELNFPTALNTGLNIPYMHLMHPIEPDLKVPFTMRLNQPGLEGTFDEETGEITDLAGTVDFIIVLGVGKNPLDLSIPLDLADPPLNLFARCRISDVPVSFSTSGTRDYVHFKGQPYTEGLGGDGAIATFWGDLPDPTVENGDAEAEENCGSLANLVHGDGGIWLSRGIAEPIVPPDPEPSCETDYRLCEPDEPEPFVSIRKLRLQPKARKARAGKKIRIKVRVRNAGTKAANGVTVKLRSSNGRVRIRKKIRMKVPAGSWAVKAVPVKIGNRARGKAKITARTNGLTARAKIKVKPLKKKKQR